MEDSIQIKIRNHTPAVYRRAHRVRCDLLHRADSAAQGFHDDRADRLAGALGAAADLDYSEQRAPDGHPLRRQPSALAAPVGAAHLSKSMRCEPYEVHSRCGTQLRIMLTLELHTQIGDEPETIEFNDSVKAAALLDEKLGGKPTDIPLVQLYQFLRAHTSE